MKHYGSLRKVMVTLGTDQSGVEVERQDVNKKLEERRKFWKRCQGSERRDRWVGGNDRDWKPQAQAQAGHFSLQQHP